MKFIDTLAAIMVPLFWGLNIAVVKTAVLEFPPVFLTGLRFLSVAVLLIWWFPIPRKQLPLICLLGISFGSVHFGGVFFGLQGVDVSMVAILSMAGVPMAVVFARLLLKERFSRQQSFGMAAAFIGVLIIFGEPHLAAKPVYLVVVILAVIAWGYGNTIIKLIGPVHPMALNAWMGLFAAGPLLLLSLFMEAPSLTLLSHLSIKAWLCFLHLVFLTTITAYGLWYYLVGKYNVTRVVPFTLLVPIAGVFAGVVFMDESLTWQKVVGGLITLAGITVIQLHLPSMKHLRIGRG